MKHNITDLGIPDESELRGIGITSLLAPRGGCLAEYQHWIKAGNMPSFYTIWQYREPKL